MAKYYVNTNAQPTGEHEVHTTDCSQGADEGNRKYLGSYNNCEDALEAAKDHFDDVDGCYYCCYDCHNR